MKKTKNIIAALIMLIVAVVAAGTIWAMFTQTTNCGGNGAALPACATSVMEIKRAPVDTGKNYYDINKLPLDQRIGLVRCANNHWITGAKIFLRTNVALNSEKKQILAVCDTPYGNIPQPTIWNGYRKNLAHAVGYSDGTTGLIKPEEFKKLNLAEFVDAALLPTNDISTTNSRPLP